MVNPRLLAVTVAVALFAGVPCPASAGEDEPAAAPAPEMSARDLNGRPFTLASAWAEGPVAVTFWATWCKPCRKELPELQKLADRYGKRGFSVVAVSGDGPVDQAKVRPYVRASKFDFTVIPDPDGVWRRRFQVEVFPTTFLIDREGNIVHYQVGYRRGDEKLLERALTPLLPPPVAPAPATQKDLGR